MQIVNSIVGFMQEGGFFMYPILLVLALGLAIAIERFLYLSSTKSSNIKTWKQMLPLIEKGRFGEAMNLAADSGAAVGKILAYGLSRLKSSQQRDGGQLCFLW